MIRFLILASTTLVACNDGPSGTPEGQPPTVAITVPLDGGVLHQGNPIPVSGTVADSSDAPAALSVTWTLDGSVALAIDVADDGTVSGVIAADALGLGAHVAVLEAVDTDGNSASAQVAFTLLGPVGPPSVEITAPADGFEVAPGDPITFVGEASDLSTSADSLVFAWSSSLDGALAGAVDDANGTSTLTRSNLSTGRHVVTLDVTDTDGETGHDTVTVDVVAVGPPDTGLGDPYDVFADFHVVTNNDTQVWQYGSAEKIGGDLTLYTVHYDYKIPGIVGWTDDELDPTPNAATNTTGKEVELGAVFPAEDWVSVHPGIWPAYYTVIRFVVPVDGDWTVDCAFKSLHIGSVDVHVLAAGTSVFDATVSGPYDADLTVNTPYVGTLSLAAGDTIDFVVGPGAAYINGGDTTGLRATITKESKE